MPSLKASRARRRSCAYLNKSGPLTVRQQALSTPRCADDARRRQGRQSMAMECLTLVGTLVFLVASAVMVSAVTASAVMGAENLVENPSAEDVADSGMPRGWGRYVGAGGVRVTATSDEQRSGQSAACLELDKWYTPKDAPDTPENHSVSGAIILAENNGYRGDGALSGVPGTRYAFSFWYKGTIPAAKVIVNGWPADTADHDQRISVPVSATPLRPGDQWQQCAGSFRIPEGVGRFAVLIHASGQEAKGFRLGKLYVDDAYIAAKQFPDGELRGVWWGFVKAQEAEAGRREIDDSLDKLKAAGINSLFVWTSSLYLAALDRPELQDIQPQAGWDAYGEIIRAAKQRDMQVHAWFSPWIYKSASGAVELRDHPEWAAVNAAGVPDTRGLCFIRPEVRQYELDLLARLVDRYPDLAGIHIEEPGFNWGADYCYCEHCQTLCRQWFGIDIRQDSDAVRPALHNLAAFMCSDFFARLQEMALAKRPGIWLSANGSGGRNADWYIGRDWTTWARRGYLDFYVPQLYTKSVDAFQQRGLETKSCLGECGLVTGMAVSWSSIYPERQDPEVIKAEITAARQLGAQGFIVFHRDHIYDEHLTAIREAVEAADAAPSKADPQTQTPDP